MTSLPTVEAPPIVDKFNESGRGSVEEEKMKEVPMDDGDKLLSSLLYTVEETPPWYLCIVLALQQSMTCFGGNLSVALIVAPAMCVQDNVVVSQILGTIFFMSGLVSLLQSTLGTRLPLVQGATFSFIVPTFAILNLPKWKCPAMDDSSSVSNDSLWSHIEAATEPSGIATSDQPSSEQAGEDNWKPRMLEIQGAIMIASLFEVVLGLSGLIGLLVRYIGPLVIAPTITLVGLALFPAAANFASKNWYIAILTSILILVFSQYLRNVNIPFCGRNDEGQCTRVGYPIFTLFPVLISILLVWGLCAILTTTGALPDDENHWSYNARTDVKSSVLSDSAWFRFPYPFQWGIPTFSVGAIFGMLAGVIAGAVESVGDYYSCARLAGASPPPVHAVNRGIFIEGIGCVLAGMWGTASGSTTYSENVGAIGITKVGSRRVVQLESCFMMIFGVLGKFGALFITIPDPIIGGVFLVLFGMIASVGVSNLQFVDLNSSRNLCIFGFSVFFGLAFPTWLSAHSDYISTGNPTVDQILVVLLSTSMFVGGVIGFILDNTVPGADDERGMKQWRKHMSGPEDIDNNTAQNHHSGIEAGHPVLNGHIPSETGVPEATLRPAITSEAVRLLARKANAGKCYEFPIGMNFLRNWRPARYIPVCPTFLQKSSANSEISGMSETNHSTVDSTSTGETKDGSDIYIVEKEVGNATFVNTGYINNVGNEKKYSNGFHDSVNSNRIVVSTVM